MKCPPKGLWGSLRFRDDYLFDAPKHVGKEASKPCARVFRLCHHAQGLLARRSPRGPLPASRLSRCRQAPAPEPGWIIIHDVHGKLCERRRRLLRLVGGGAERRMRAYNAEASNPCVPQRMDRKAEEWGRKENAHALPPRTMMSPATAARNMGRIFCPPGKFFDCERVTTLSSQTAGQRAGSVHPPIPFSSSLKTHWEKQNVCPKWAKHSFRDSEG